jgi:hypothetical protein
MRSTSYSPLYGVPALLQQGIVDDPDPGHYRFFPSLAVDRNGNVALASVIGIDTAGGG